MALSAIQPPPPSPAVLARAPGGMAAWFVALGMVAFPGAIAAQEADTAARPPAQTPATPRTVDQDAEWLDRADASRTYVSDTTNVRIDEFIDFACPSCQGFFVLKGDSLKTQLVDTGEVNFVVRAFPLPRLMRGFQAAEAALCAGALRGRRGFEGMQHRLFMNQNVWRALLDPTGVFLRFAQEMELPMQEFQECILRDAMAPLILSDMNLAQVMGVNGTPTLVFNRSTEILGDVVTSGNPDLARIRELIALVAGTTPSGE